MAYLLARAGVSVVWLDLPVPPEGRGDPPWLLRPSLLEVIDQLGLLSALRAAPHRPIAHINAATDDRLRTLTDMAAVSDACGELVVIEGRELTGVLADAAAAFPGFVRIPLNGGLRFMLARGRFAGVASEIDGVECRAPLTILAGGRGRLLAAQVELSGNVRPGRLAVSTILIPRPEVADPSQACVRFGPRAALVCLPLPGRDMMRCTALIRAKDMTRREFSGPARLREIMGVLATEGEGAIHGADDALPTWRIPAVTSSVRWRRPGLLSLPGDALSGPWDEVFNPGFCLWDGLAFAAALAARLRSGRSVEGALARPGKRRLQAARRIVADTSRADAWLVPPPARRGRPQRLPRRLAHLLDRAGGADRLAQAINMAGGVEAIDEALLDVFLDA